jgi:AcrR family transcriptional regulator
MPTARRGGAAAGASEAPVRPLSEDDLGTAAQRARRKRILDSTMALATKGGFDAVQIREVAERADVALGTLYRYFPSKIHLIVSAMVEEFEQTRDKLERVPIPGETPYERVTFVLTTITRKMQREPNLTEAMTRAVMFADASVAAEVEHIDRLMEEMVTRAMGTSDPTEEERAVARVIGSVWLANLVAWVTGRASASDVVKEIELATRLLLRP